MNAVKEELSSEINYFYTVPPGQLTSILMAGRKESLEYSCEICGASDPSDEEMRMHVVECHMQTTVICPICNEPSESTQDMLFHVNSDHLEYWTPDQDMIAFIDKEYNLWNGAESEENPTLSSHMNNVHVNSNSGVGKLSKTKVDTFQIGGAGTNSPQRQNLDLKLPNTKTKPIILISPLNVCPICNKFTCNNTKDMENHVIKDHFDLTSPSVNGSTSGNSPQLKCPLCSKNFSQSTDVELHVNIELSDILSPGKTQSPQCLVCCLDNIGSSQSY